MTSPAATQALPLDAGLHSSQHPQVCCTAPYPCVGSCDRSAVGEIRHVERELDDAIRELGKCAEQAMQDGDKETAREFSSRMYAAIRSRTPEHQARLSAEADQRVDECTFAGDWAMRMARGLA